jgi:hypothetical protein
MKIRLLNEMSKNNTNKSGGDNIRTGGAKPLLNTPMCVTQFVLVLY